MSQQSLRDYAYELYGVIYPGDNDIVLVNAFIAGVDAAYKELQPEIEELKDKLAAALVELNKYKGDPNATVD